MSKGTPAIKKIDREMSKRGIPHGPKKPRKKGARFDSARTA